MVPLLSCFGILSFSWIAARERSSRRAVPYLKVVHLVPPLVSRVQLVRECPISFYIWIIQARHVAPLLLQKHFNKGEGWREKHWESY